MIRDWDLWPWIVADGADDLYHYRMERGVNGLNEALGDALYPIVRRLAVTLSGLVDEAVG